MRVAQWQGNDLQSRLWELDCPRALQKNYKLNKIKIKMLIKLYNTLTRKKEIFKPLKQNEAGIYTCGPTVYWYQHIGNLRSYVFPDILKRILKLDDYKVKHIINVTDVGHLTSDADEGEDKMEKAVKKEGRTAKEIADYYFEIFEKDLVKKYKTISKEDLEIFYLADTVEDAYKYIIKNVDTKNIRQV